MENTSLPYINPSKWSSLVWICNAGWLARYFKTNMHCTLYEPRLCTLTLCIYPQCCRLQNTIQQNNSYTPYPVTESRWFVLLVPEDKSHTLRNSLHPTRNAHRWELSILEGHSVSRKKETKNIYYKYRFKNKEQTTQQLRQTYSFTTANFSFL